MPGIARPVHRQHPQRIHEHLSDKPFFTIQLSVRLCRQRRQLVRGRGPPFSAYDDAGRENAYPLVRVQATTFAAERQQCRGDGRHRAADLGRGELQELPLRSADVEFTSRTAIPTDALTEDIPRQPESSRLPVVDKDRGPRTKPVMPRRCRHRVGDGHQRPAPARPQARRQLRGHSHGRRVTPVRLTPATSPANPQRVALCLTNQALVQNKPVVCQVCHYTPALDLAQLGPLAGPEDTIANGRNQVAHQSNSRVMHNHHGQFDDEGPLLNTGAGQDPVHGPITNQGGTSSPSGTDTATSVTRARTPSVCVVRCSTAACCVMTATATCCRLARTSRQGVSPQNPGDFKLGHGNFYDPPTPPATRTLGQRAGLRLLPYRGLHRQSGGTAGRDHQLGRLDGNDGRYPPASGLAHR